RGGGSIEDLWAFNDEKVARAIFASKIPVISAVGHEPDVTIADFVADLRAATPSNGAELVAPDQLELRLQLDDLQRRMALSMEKRLKLARQRLDGAASRRVLQSPMYYVIDRRNCLDAQEKHLESAMNRLLEYKKRNFISLATGLDAMSPLKVLGRGYSLVKLEDQLVKSVAQVSEGDELTVSLADGTVTTTVTGRNEYA
ncbi:MAG: exodeoxyribonuclease VII large subunit, partial [Eubacteriales bacterium]